MVTRPPARFGLLLTLLVTTYLFSAFTSGEWIEATQVALFVVAALLALRDSPMRGRGAGLAVAAVVVASAIVFGVGLRSSDQVVLGVVSIWGGGLLLASIVLIVHRVMSLTSVTAQSIYGAVSAYLLLGFMFAAGYAAINHLDGSHFFTHGQPANTRTLQYFSFTTLTTLGYGDFTAAGDGGRAVAVLEAVLGQVFLATLVARLVSAYGKSTRRDKSLGLCLGWSEILAEAHVDTTPARAAGVNAAGVNRAAGVKQRAQIVMTGDEIDQMLAGVRTMTMASIGPGGMPHLVAMWFTVVDGDICFETKSKSQKAVNLRRDPRITCLAEDGGAYEDLRGVAIEGRAEVSDDADLLWRIGVGVWERYTGPYTEELRPYVEAMLHKRVAVRVRAERVRSWDHRKLGLPASGDLRGSTITAPGRRIR